MLEIIPTACIIILGILLAIAVGQKEHWREQAERSGKAAKYWEDHHWEFLENTVTPIYDKNRWYERVHEAQRRLIESREQQIEILTEKYHNAIRTLKIVCTVRKQKQKTPCKKK